MKRFQSKQTTGKTKTKRSTTSKAKTARKQKKPVAGKRKRSTGNQTEGELSSNDKEENRKKTWMNFAGANSIVQDSQFWELGKQVLKFLAPILKKIGLLETDVYSIGMVYATFVDLLKNPRFGRPTLFNDTAARILELLQSRWEFLHTDTMEIGFLLDPTQNPDDFVDNDCNDLLEYIRVVAARLGLDGVMQVKAFREANAFINTKRDWTPDERTKQGEVPPLEWWGNHRKHYLALFDIARRVFTIPTSSVAPERSWSTHKYIHSNLRNKLKQESLCKIVFVCSNRNGSDAVPKVTCINKAPQYQGEDDGARNDATISSDGDSSGDECLALRFQDNAYDFSNFDE